MTIPLVDLKAQYASIKHEVDGAVEEVLSTCSFVGGKVVESFEREFAAFCDASYAVGVGNGTDALQLALLACGIGKGAEVITVAHTFTATAEAIMNVGARPVFVDVDETYNIDVKQVVNRVTTWTKAIIPVHLYGQPADMDPLMAVADRHGLAVIEDAAQAHGARYKGRRTGSLGHIACFSFYPGKNLGAYGDGGAVVTSNPELARRVRLLRDHGRTDKYLHERVGFNSRLDALQAAVLRVKLARLDEWNTRRRDHAALYDRLLAEIPRIVTPRSDPRVEHVYHLYVIQVPNRDFVKSSLKEEGIETGIHYPIPLHRQPAYGYLGYKPEEIPATNALAGRLLSLPMYPELTDDRIRKIVDVLRKAVED